MAEGASCSGTTPLKRLVDHQARDASHHQDRFVGRPGTGSSATFRSAPSHTTAHGSAESFGAFLDGQSAMPSQGPLFLPNPGPSTYLTGHAATLQPADAIARASTGSNTSASWAADFTRTTMLQQLQKQQKQKKQKMRSAVAPRGQHFYPSPSTTFNFQAAFRPPGAAFAPPMHHQGGVTPTLKAQVPASDSDFHQEMDRCLATHGRGDMSKVDAAMDELAETLALQHAEHDEVSGSPQPQDEIVASNTTDLDTLDIGNLSIQWPLATPIEPLATQAQDAPLHAAARDEDNGASHPAACDKSAVSEAAGRLVARVQHEQGEKWRNSVFLSLMRDLRDGRRDIVDDEICPSLAASHAKN